MLRYKDEARLTAQSLVGIPVVGSIEHTCGGCGGGGDGRPFGCVVFARSVLCFFCRNFVKFLGM